MEIKMYQPGDESTIVNLFEKVFQRPWSLEQWQWRFSQNPAGIHKIALMWDKDVLVGHYAVSPVVVQINGEAYTTALSLTTMTHPEYGGRGIFKNLSTYLYEYLENEEGYQFIWGFPNTNSHYGFIKHLGWKDINAVHTLAASFDGFTTSSDTEVTRSSKFTDGMAALINGNAKKCPVSVVRSKKYLQWRIVDKPATQYDIWVLGHEEDPSAVFITKIYPVNDECADLNIIEWACKDISLFLPIIASIKYQKLQGAVTIRNITLWQNLFQIATYGALEKMGFAPQAPITYFAGRAATSIAPQVLDYKNWHLSFLDSDVY